MEKQKEEEHFRHEPQRPTQVSASPGATLLHSLNGWAPLSLLHVIKSLMSPLCSCAPRRTKDLHPSQPCVVAPIVVMETQERHMLN